MKSLIKVTGLIALAGAAFFALNAGSALAAPPPPLRSEVITAHPVRPADDLGPELDLPLALRDHRHLRRPATHRPLRPH